MSTTPVNTTGSPDIQRTRWRIDPQRSSVEFYVRQLWGLQTVKGRFERYDGSLDLAAQPSIELTIKDELEVDVETFADHRLLGMTWNRMGMMRTPSKLVVQARLVQEEK